jgi:hypothetical protein
MPKPEGEGVIHVVVAVSAPFSMPILSAKVAFPLTQTTELFVVEGI